MRGIDNVVTEKEELIERQDRTRSGITQHLIDMGVQPDAAERAVKDQVKFGRAPNGTLLIKRGPWEASAVSFQRECAQHILSSIPAEQRRGFSTGEPDSAWTASERRLHAASETHSHEQLVEQAREERIARARGDVGSVDDKPLTIDELVQRKRRANPIY